MVGSKRVCLIPLMCVTWLLAAGCGDNLPGGDAQPDAGPGGGGPAGNTIRGQLWGHTGSVVDSDVNDPEAPYQDNNTVGAAQAVVLPVTVGGYVNAPGAGPDGRSKTAGDVVDVYRMSLETGQLVLLSFETDDPQGAEDARNALQVYLLDLDGNPVLDADEFPVEGRYQAESVRYFFVEQPGEYLVAVQAIKGASTYLLLADHYHGDALSRSTASYKRDQVVVRFAPRLAPLASPDAYRGLTHKAGHPSREVLFTYDASAPGRFLGQWGGSHLTTPSIHRSSAASVTHPRREVRGPITPRTAAMLIERDAAVEVAGANFLVKPMFVPNDTHYDVQWGFQNTHAEMAWDQANGSGVVVAVIDTGVDTDHPDLAENLTAGYDFVLDADNAGDGDGIDADPQQSRTGSHGTHVAGTIAAVTNNERGVAGLAWGAKVMPLRALGEEGGTEYDVGQSLRYAAGLDNDSKTLPKIAARVVNMSLGGPESSRWFQRVVYDAVRAGTVVVAASGNDNSAAPAYPAWYRHVVSVGSTNRRDTKSSFSNYGPTVDLAAPGSQIGSTWGSGEYNYSSGTSMASPHAAAWIALMLSANPDLTPADVDDIIAKQDVFTDLGDAGRDDSFGYGLIDAHKAVTVAAGYEAGSPVVIPELATSPDQLIFGPRQWSAFVKGGNIGDGSLSITGAASASSWVSVEGFSSTAEGVNLEVRVNREELATPGIYHSRVVLESDTGPHVLPVMVVVRPHHTPTHLGRLYVSLEGASGPTQTAPAVDGVFSFERVPDGDYRVVVTSDLDNDGGNCTRGEACGAYGGLSDPTAVSPPADQVEVVSDWLFQ